MPYTIVDSVERARVEVMRIVPTLKKMSEDSLVVRPVSH